MKVKNVIINISLENGMIHFLAAAGTIGLA